MTSFGGRNFGRSFLFADLSPDITATSSAGGRFLKIRFTRNNPYFAGSRDIFGHCVDFP
ncbi:hypothetical protein C789_3835 [Microcystis aeruginosa FACHB-905 = DIANCHI905]|nr:hypothetical protein C789_3835 [Microcystis aeruginosa FACHB-905 = DIANCHI905]